MNNHGTGIFQIQSSNVRNFSDVILDLAKDCMIRQRLLGVYIGILPAS